MNGTIHVRMSFRTINIEIACHVNATVRIMIIITIHAEIFSWFMNEGQNMKVRIWSCYKETMVLK